MMIPMIDAYREAGVRMLPAQALVDKPRGTSFAGELVLAPPSARGTPWMRRLGDISDALTSGLMRVRGVRRQRAYDRGFVLSDHADWPGLNAAIDATGASRIIVTHGQVPIMVRWLVERGLHAQAFETEFDNAGENDALPARGNGDEAAAGSAAEAATDDAEPGAGIPG